MISQANSWLERNSLLQEQDGPIQQAALSVLLVTYLSVVSYFTYLTSCIDLLLSTPLRFSSAAFLRPLLFQCCYHRD